MSTLQINKPSEGFKTLKAHCVSNVRKWRVRLRHWTASSTLTLMSEEKRIVCAPDYACRVANGLPSFQTISHVYEILTVQKIHLYK